MGQKNLVKIDNESFMVIELPNRPKGLLDRTIAQIYGVTTREVNQAVKNNPDKFPEDFCFNASLDEFKIIKNLDTNFIEVDENGSENLDITEPIKTCDQFSNIKHSSVMPTIFTLEGCNMLATILKSPMAIKRAVQIIRAFTRLESLYNQKKSSNHVQITVNEIGKLRESSVDSFSKLKISLAKATDYDTNDNIRGYFANLQNLIHIVATGMNASEIKISRVDAEKIHCGAFSGYQYGKNKLLNPKSMYIARNFLKSNELQIEQDFVNMLLLRLKIAMLKELRIYTVDEFMAFIYTLAECISIDKGHDQMTSKQANQIVDKEVSEYNDNKELLKIGFEQYDISRNKLPLFDILEQKLLVVKE